MIGTFWNLCRACPSIPIDKNRSEYRSTYQWYEYTGPRQEVVKQAPQPIPTRLEEYEQKGGFEVPLININKNEGTKQFKENTIEGITCTKNCSHCHRHACLNTTFMGLDKSDEDEASSNIK